MCILKSWHFESQDLGTHNVKILECTSKIHIRKETCFLFPLLIPLYFTLSKNMIFYKKHGWMCIFEISQHYSECTFWGVLDSKPLHSSLAPLSSDRVVNWTRSTKYGFGFWFFTLSKTKYTCSKYVNCDQKTWYKYNIFIYIYF